MSSKVVMLTSFPTIPHHLIFNQIKTSVRALNVSLSLV